LPSKEENTVPPAKGGKENKAPKLKGGGSKRERQDLPYAYSEEGFGKPGQKKTGRRPQSKEKKAQATCGSPQKTNLTKQEERDREIVGGERLTRGGGRRAYGRTTIFYDGAAREGRLKVQNGEGYRAKRESGNEGKGLNPTEVDFADGAGEENGGALFMHRSEKSGRFAE